MTPVYILLVGSIGLCCLGARPALGAAAVAKVRERRQAEPVPAVPPCLMFEGPPGNAANGEYIRDDSLPDCSRDGKPRYRHISKPQFLYSFYDPTTRTERWQQAGGRVACTPAAAFICRSQLRSLLNAGSSCWTDALFGLPAQVQVTPCRVPGCVNFNAISVTGESPMPSEATGEYLRDDSLPDCSGGARARYKHRAREQYLYWVYDPIFQVNRWQQSAAVVCLPFASFFCLSNDFSVAANSTCWREGFFAVPNNNVTIRTCQDSCADSPCVNGFCSPQGPSYRCTCYSEFIGRNCSDPDPCSPNPCANGLCRRNATEFSCDCFPGWNGTTCSVVQPLCSPNPCKNGGVCQEKDVGFDCKCAMGYTGPRCDVAVWFNPLDLITQFLNLFTTMKKEMNATRELGTEAEQYDYAYDVTN